VHEGRLGAGLARGLEEVQRAGGVGVEVVERDGRGAVMRGLGGGVDDDGGLDRLDEGEDAGAVADVELVVDEALEFLGQTLLVPAGVALRAEEDGALVVVDAVDGVAKRGEVDADFGADETRGTGDEEGFSLRERRSGYPCRAGMAFPVDFNQNNGRYSS
jgi:hypothetical protein